MQNTADKYTALQTLRARLMDAELAGRRLRGIALRDARIRVEVAVSRSREYAEWRAEHESACAARHAASLGR